MKKIFVLLSFFLLGCGIPDASSFETLLAPFILDDKTVYPQCTKTTTGIKVELKVQVYNIESSFSGYNIYYMGAFSGQTELENSLRTAVTSHITNANSSTKSFNKQIELVNIIKNKTSLPTIPAGSSAIEGYNIKPTEAILVIEKKPDNTNLPPELYGFTVTATSLPNITESVMSNAIIVNGTKATDDTPGPLYCGGM